MKKFFLVVLVLAFTTSLCTQGIAAENLQVQTIAAEAERIATIVDESGDYEALAPIAESFYKSVLPTFAESDIIGILEDDNLGTAYKTLVIDMYSLAVQEGERQNKKDIAAVDNALVRLIEPDGELSIMAMASLSDPTIAPVNQLKEMMEKGNSGEKISAMKLLCRINEGTAAQAIKEILESKNADGCLYDAAINFSPRVIGNTSGITDEYAISTIKEILENTGNEKIQITCVQALIEIGTDDAISAVYEEKDRLPIELINYCERKTGTESGLSEIANAITPRGASNRLGNALYRDGVGSLGIDIDWHAGLVGHSSGPFYQNGEWVIHHPGRKAIVQYDTFIAFLTDENGERHTDTGEYYLSTVSNNTTYDIFYTAHDLTNEGIAYTLSPMLRTSKSSGKIEPSDITKIRCDGVVEYCYEYNGVRLQGLSSENLWDISTVQGAEYHPASYMPSMQAKCFNREVAH